MKMKQWLHLLCKQTCLYLKSLWPSGFQYFTLLRLYDFGYFDLSVDKRNFMEKIQDKAEKDAEEYFEVFLDFIDPPKEKDDKSWVWMSKEMFEKLIQNSGF